MIATDVELEKLAERVKKLEAAFAGHMQHPPKHAEPGERSTVDDTAPAQPIEPLYPCAKCGKMRTKAEGGTTFTTCEGHGFNCDGTPECEQPSEPAEVTSTTALA